MALARVGLLLAVAYLLLIGGQYYGLVVFEINVLSLTLFIGSVILWFAWRARSGLTRTPLDVVIWIALALGAFNVSLSLDPSRSAGALWLGMVWACIYWAAADLLNDAVSHARLGRAIYVAGSVIVFIAFAQVILFWRDWLALGLLPSTSFRVAASNPTAMITNFVWTLWIAEVITTKRWWAKVFWGAGVIVAGVVLLYTSSRGGWLGATGAFLILSALYRREWIAWSKRLYTRIFWRVTISFAVVIGAATTVYVAIKQFEHRTHAPTIALARVEFWPVAEQMFWRSPFIGQGLFTYSSFYLPSLSVPPRGVFNQAHGLIHNLLAETGVLGTSVFLTGFIIFFRSVPIFKFEHEADHWRIAAFASLGGTLIHSVFETPYVNPPIMALSALACAMLMPMNGRGWRNALLVIGVAAIGVWGVWAYQPLHEGITLGNDGKWREATQKFDEALKRDPFSTWAKLQAGYSFHRAGDPRRAIDLYSDALKHEPGYSINWANMAAAYWALGDKESAMKMLNESLTRAPNSALLYATQAAWSGKPVTQDSTSLDMRITDVMGGRTTADILLKDRESLTVKLASGSIESFEVIQLAEIEIAYGNLGRADYLLRYAEAMRGDDGAALDLAWGDLLAARGDLKEAAKRYAHALLETRPDEYGNGTEYGWLIFARESLRPNIALELAVPPSLEYRARLKILTDWYVVLGDTVALDKLRMKSNPP